MACEVTLQPLRRYSFDAAILSDILTIPDAMGQGLHFEASEKRPRFKKVIQTRADVDSLREITAIDDLSYVMSAVILIRNELNGSVPLIGFSGSP